jgi:hypothetical protein
MAEWVPWYRRKDYKGNLTEEEKRHLESFRSGDRHPAATYEDLPDEVQTYISELELALYDRKQESAVTKAMVFSLFGAFAIYSAYRDVAWLGPTVGYLIGAGLIVIGWVNYRREWKRNADALWIENNDAPGVPFSRAQEALQQNWEIAEIGRFRRRGAGGAFDE